MPVAFRVGAIFVEGSSPSVGESSWERPSVPLDFLGAVLAFAFLGTARCDFSSSARRRSRSAFLRAASAFLSASASLDAEGLCEPRKACRGRWGGIQRRRCAYFFAFDFAPLDHSLSSVAADLASAAACFWAATSAFCTDSKLAFGRLAVLGRVWPDLCIPSGFLGVLATFLASHDHQIGSKVYNDEETDVWADRVGWHTTVMTGKRFAEEKGIGLKYDWAAKSFPQSRGKKTALV
jgi:hypothetical protein